LSTPSKQSQLPRAKYQQLILAMRGIDQVLPVFPRAKGPSQQEGPKIISKKALSDQHSAKIRLANCYLPIASLLKFQRS
jgi:hypothetical protein